MELTLEKIMLMLVGLCFASMICIPLIQNGVSQISDQYAYSQFQDMVGSIDPAIRTVMNGTGQRYYEGDIYIPNGTTINSSISRNRVSYYFNSDSSSIAIHKNYPLAVAVNFNYKAGWYRIRIVSENATLVTVSFTFIGS
nr:hypothetical protein [Candidatus Njordarchaeota archaeon]